MNLLALPLYRQDELTTGTAKPWKKNILIHFSFSGHLLIQPESKTFVFIETMEISKQFISI